MLDESSSAIHVVFLLHGLWGNPTQMYTLRDALKSHADEVRCNVRVWCCESYQRSKTCDGIDICADRAIDEITEQITTIRNSGKFIQKFSILGYSLGGLIARVVVKHLTSTKSSILNNVELCNFATFASPAIGIPSIAGPLSKTIQGVQAFLLSRSGEHLYLRDRRGVASKPLVYDLATPEYTDAVNKFKNVDVYVNCVADNLVPYISAAMETYDPFSPALERARKLEMKAKGDRLTLDSLTLTFDHKFPSILTAFHVSAPEQEDPSSEEPEPEEIDPGSPVFRSPLKPTRCQKIRPWFLPATYKFLPHPLNYALVASIPLVVPAIPLVVCAFAYQKVASSVRIRKYLRDHPETLASTTCSKSGTEDFDRDLNHTTAELNPVDDLGKSAVLEGSPPTSVDLKRSNALSDTQVEIVDMLRRSLHMRMHRAFIPNVWNSHAVIICQNPNISDHLFGRSAVEHWAHHFEF